MYTFLLPVLVSIGGFGAMSAPEGVDLAALAGWDVVVAENAIASEVYAAEEFQRILHRARGPKLPIVRQITRPDRHVFIGPSEALRKSAVGFDVGSFGPEDLRIIVRDQNIAVAGGRPRGTLYGVFTFLEDYLGVRFLTLDHTHVPLLGDWQRVGPIDRFYHPPFEFRWVAYEANYARPDFAARLRLNAARVKANPVGSKDGGGVGKYGGRTPMRHINHSFFRQLPPAKYAADHPEYYCLYKGRRYATIQSGAEGVDFKRGQFPYGMQPCLSHADVFRIITDHVLNDFSDRPDLLNVSVAQNDGGKHCQCPPCAALDEREGTKMGAVLTFVNRVADRVAQEYPDRMISTTAYSDTAAPPKTLRPRDNVQVMWCSIGTCFIHAFTDQSCPQNDVFVGELRRWAKITSHLYTWNYYLHGENHGYQLPVPNLRLIGPNLRYQRSLGVRGVFLQATGSCHGNEWEELRNYLLSNLMWNPARDGDRLMSEWLRLHYGPAAPPIEQWINRLHDRSVASGKHCRCLGGKFSDYGLDGLDAQAGIRAFEQAMRLAGDNEVVRNRVEKASIMAYRAIIEPIWSVKTSEELDPSLAIKMRPFVKQFFELCKKHGATRTAEGDWQRMDKQEERLRTLLEPWG